MTFRSIISAKNLALGSSFLVFMLANATTALASDPATKAFDAIAKAKQEIAILISDYEESELDALLGVNNLSRLNAKIEDVRRDLNSGDVRMSRVEEDLKKLEKSYLSVLDFYESQLKNYCDSPKFADRVGDALDAAGEFSYRAAGELNVKIKLPRPLSTARACPSEIDGR